MLFIHTAEVALDFFAARHFDGQDRTISVKIHYYPSVCTPRGSAPQRKAETPRHFIDLYGKVRSGNYIISFLEGIHNTA